MNSIELIANAKINLSLDVLSRRPDGYHELRMIMQTIKLHDTVLLSEIRHGIEVCCDKEYVPSGSDNITYKAANLLIEKCGIKSGIKINITKRIPMAAGLAGGSTDAAAVLKGMNQLFTLGLTESELMSIGKQIGADVPYCIKGGTMLAEGIGEKLTPLNPLPAIDIVLIKPPIDVSTAWVYKSLCLEKITNRPNTDILIKAVNERRLDLLAGGMKNVLESVTIQEYGIIEEIKSKLLEFGAVGSMMSGSGPSVFGIFADRQTAKNTYEAMNNSSWECYLTETV